MAKTQKPEALDVAPDETEPDFAPDTTPEPEAPKAPKAPKVVAPAASAEDEYPKAKYVKDATQPNGYRVKRVQDAHEEARLGPEWKGSPADL